MEITVDIVIAEGDKVAYRYTWQGTHTGELQGVAATGRRATIIGMAICRLEGGRVAEEWWSTDSLGLMQQLGAVPAPE